MPSAMTEFASEARAGQRPVKGGSMKKIEKSDQDDMRPEYDLTALGPGVRGKYYSRATAGMNVVRLDADVAAAFPNEMAVNAALRGLLRSGTTKTRKNKRSAARRRA